ncbi:hypothetical protein B566_EDAN005927 [Ephemera danica]|nr:hypothetical protein B566_EDAN005927 [Ephemera danica]
MNSVNQDPWVSESSGVDDFSVVELLLKSLDSSEAVHGQPNYCWTTPTSTDPHNEIKPSSDKIGYEPYSLPSLSSVFKQTIKQEPYDDSCLVASVESPETLDVGVQCSTPSAPELLHRQFATFYPSTQCSGFGHPGIGPSENWPTNNYSSNFEALKVVPELLVERIHQDEVFSAAASQHVKFETSFGEIIVKKEPSDDAMNLSGHFMCHPMFMMNPPGSSKCGCDLSKSQSHFLCNNKAMSMEEYGELLKRNTLLSEPQVKNSTPHQSIRSDKERPFSCDECGKSFLLKHHLVTHSRVHSGLRPFGCNDCGKTFAHKHCLVTHQRLHSGLRPFQCTECKKSFTLKHHLVTHSRTHSKDRPFHCDECGKTFSQKRNLVTHAKLHSGERPFQCAICGECFSQREHLLAHSRFHGGESAFVCMDCGEAFARKFQLVDHRRQHGHSPYSCGICGKEFLQKRTLVAHTKLHETGSIYSCKHCSQSFPHMSDLVAHSRLHNNFSCKECGCNFPSNEDFVLHLQHHGQVPNSRQASAQTKPFTCVECGSGFAQKHGLVQHMNRKHSKVPEKMPVPGNLANCDIMEQIKHQVLSEQLKAKIL